MASEEFVGDDELQDLIREVVRSHTSSSYDGAAFWILVSGFLVFFMHAGFAMLEAGSVRDRNKVNILFKNIGTVTFGGIAYFLVGYGLAYGEAVNNSFLGTSDYAGEGFLQEFLGNENDRRDFFFQYAFCVTAATITSGAVAGRIKLTAYLLLAVLLTSFVYPIVTHWVWSGTGWLSAFKDEAARFILDGVYPQACGVIDYAGSGVVHLTGGVSAFWSAAILGPRVGRFNGKSVNPMPGHNMAMATLGTFILWFGWYGFNCGSALAFDGVNVPKVAVTTSLAPAAACMTTIGLQRFRTGHYDLPSALNGILAGLVSITAGCSTVNNFAAIPIGIIGAFIYIYSSELLLYFKIDDPIGASPVHGFCGIWGVLAVGIFGTPEFLAQAYSCRNPPVGGDGDWLDPLPGYQMLHQVILVLAIIGWVTAIVVPFMTALRFLGMLRVPDDEQEVGLDRSEHGVADIPPEDFLGETNEAVVQDELLEETKDIEDVKVVEAEDAPPMQDATDAAVDDEKEETEKGSPSANVLSI